MFIDRLRDIGLASLIIAGETACSVPVSSPQPSPTPLWSHRVETSEYILNQMRPNYIRVIPKYPNTTANGLKALKDIEERCEVPKSIARSDEAILIFPLPIEYDVTTEKPDCLSSFPSEAIVYSR